MVQPISICFIPNIKYHFNKNIALESFSSHRLTRPNILDCSDFLLLALCDCKLYATRFLNLGSHFLYIEPVQSLLPTKYRNDWELQ